jgi:hypothetical protein
MSTDAESILAELHRASEIIAERTKERDEARAGNERLRGHLTAIVESEAPKGRYFSEGMTRALMEARADLRASRPSVAPPAPPTATCYVCGRPATCLGAYEGREEEQYGCDEHCGHGNEDGYCAPVPTPATPPADTEPGAPRHHPACVLSGPTEMGTCACSAIIRAVAAHEAAMVGEAAVVAVAKRLMWEQCCEPTDWTQSRMDAAWDDDTLPEDQEDWKKLARLVLRAALDTVRRP